MNVPQKCVAPKAACAKFTEAMNCGEAAESLLFRLILALIFRFGQSRRNQGRPKADCQTERHAPKSPIISIHNAGEDRRAGKIWQQKPGSGGFQVRNSSLFSK
jgi:hypothetical protein